MSNCGVYGLHHNYIKIYSRPWRRLFRKTIILKCVYCGYEKRSPKD